MPSPISIRRYLLSGEFLSDELVSPGLPVARRMGDEEREGETPPAERPQVQRRDMQCLEEGHDEDSEVSSEARQLLRYECVGPVPHLCEQWFGKVFEKKALLRLIAFWQCLQGRLCWLYSEDVVKLLESSHDEIKGDFGVGYLVFTDACCLGSRVVETSAELRDIMHDILEWFVRPRVIGHAFFHFSWNDARRTRQLDTVIELRMDRLLAFTPQEVCALRKFASDVNRYERKEAFKVVYDPNALERREGWRPRARVLVRRRGAMLKHACSTCGGSGACAKLENACNHCGRLLPCSDLQPATCSHCSCLKGCTDGLCSFCGPYVLLYCRHCGLEYPSPEEPRPRLSSDDSNSDPGTADHPVAESSLDKGKSLCEELTFPNRFPDPAQSDDSDDSDHGQMQSRSKRVAQGSLLQGTGVETGEASPCSSVSSSSTGNGYS